ncbi:nuclear pore complex protein NUP96 isoform X1 [Hevea brasiliensis]|uniref:nuclear pore complex protein NUP96 isoform X1 n=1 Tax=Hevea brasiliensis TaxID=3981 RepID=UPI0025F08E29|nr:nuclear pore complex protein NUP96 isoform X1 [Hevea brasiliensis]
MFSGDSSELLNTISNAPFGISCGLDCEVGSSSLQAQHNKRIISPNGDKSCEILRKIESSLPILFSTDYYMVPSLTDLIARELLDPGYCSRVPDFTVGRLGYGCVKFLGMTDVRWLDLDQIVKFHRHEIVVYEDVTAKPPVGQGLNKPAEVTLTLQIRLSDIHEGQLKDVAEKLRTSMERQGAHFISFNPTISEWKFSVCHFSRFGLSDDDEQDIIMDDVVAVEEPLEMNDGDNPETNEETQVELEHSGPLLHHSLPAHLGLDPVKMKEMRMLMFPVEEDEEVGSFNGPSLQKLSSSKERARNPLQSSAQKMSHRSSFPVARKTPLALLEYNPGSFNSTSPGTILMSQQNKGLPLKTIRGEGFKLDLKHQTPITGSHSRNIVDAGLFMGRSFRVGWGPNGVLVHCGAPVGCNGSQRLLSSVINVEKVAIDRVVRDENNNTKKDLVEFAFDSPLNLHKTINHETQEVEVGSFKLKLQKVLSNRLILSEICRSYIDIIEKQLEVPGLSSSACLVLMHQVMIWELIKVLFSERENSGQSKSVGDDNEEDMMHDMKEGSLEIDQESLLLVRRAEFSCWLQESVCHRVQEEVSSLNDSSYLEHIFLLLTGRQLDGAVEIAVSKGDVRLACLLSQAGGSTMNRADIARQLDLWRINGLDFKFIENERIRLYELLSGNVHDALNDVKIDWKRFLGLLMWYQLTPHTSLPILFQTYQHLLDDGRAPYPLPIYIDEGPVAEAIDFTGRHFDLSYYLMLLHANGEGEFGFLKTMFSAFSSTNDLLDYHMIWHQRAVLEAVDVFSSNDLQVLDMGFVSQLLCIGQCHWAIYVALHMPFRDDYPYLQATLIREILFQYCETWSSDESQHQFIENLDIPRSWLHEAMAVYFSYNGDLFKALEHYLECENWQKAHYIFITSVSHKLFLSANHSEIWRLATSMEDHKSEIENWDLGAGIYISFYLIRSSLQENNNTMSELHLLQDSLENKSSTCRDFLGHLNESVAVFADRLPIDARVAYSKMAEEISELLLSDISEGSTRDAQLSCFDTVFNAPVLEDLRSNHLQDAVSLFTLYLSEIAT